MVALKKFFHAEKGLSLRSTGLAEQEIDTVVKDRHHTALDVPYFPSATDLPCRSMPDLKLSQPPNVGNQFEKFERKFEELHDQFHLRPMSSDSQPPSDNLSSLTTRIPRHVDLLEALFSSHRYRIGTKTLSPITPYNEDIAERNMTRFLRDQVKANARSRFMSSMYQEDVANRNIAENRSSWSSWPRVRRRPSRAAGLGTSRTTQSTPEARKRNSRRLSGDKRDEIRKRAPTSQGDLRSVLRFQDEDSTASTETVQSHRVIRAQKSAPNLSTKKMGVSQAETASGTVDYLRIPPAYKQGDMLSNTPLPDSPTLPMMLMRNQGANQNGTARRTPAPSNENSHVTASRSSSPNSSQTTRKNVRDLSIDTEIAAPGKQNSKIAHRAIQLPTPSPGPGRNPSIAEIMNSPLPAQSPTLGPHLSDSNYEVEEIMDMFKQAYISMQTTNSGPTCETLQDAIVREINSHEAFRRVPVPDNGPPFTPTSTEEKSFDQDPKTPRFAGSGLGRNLSTKEYQFTKLINRGSLKRHSRNPESRKSISTSIIPPINSRWATTGPASRRRHTDAPFPSRQLLDSMGPGEHMMAYVNDDPARKPHHQRSSTLASLRKNSDSLFGKLASSDSSANLIPQGSTEPQNTGSVYYMQAHSTGPSRDSRASYSSAADDNDDDIILLPSVSTPRLQVHGVDENNVMYIVDNATPDDAYRLMNWPKRHAGPAIQ